MSEKKPKAEVPVRYSEKAEQVDTTVGWFKDFMGQFKLAWRLLLDGRVSILAKFIPLLTTLYILFPIDIVPDMALGFGQLDDLAVFLIGLRLFIDVCPPDLVEEHKGGAGHVSRVETVWTPPQEVIDLEARVPQTNAPPVGEDED